MRKYLLIIILLLLCINTAASAFYQEYLPSFKAVLYDSKKDDYVFYGEAPMQKFYPASIAKLILALDIYNKRSSYSKKKIFCEGCGHDQNKKAEQNGEFLCYEFHDVLKLKGALAYSCNSFFKSYIASSAPKDLQETFEKYNWSIDLPEGTTLKQSWRIFMGVDNASVLTGVQMVKILQKITSDKYYAKIKKALILSRKEGTTEKLYKKRYLGLIGKTGTKIISKNKVDGVFAGWAPENRPRYYVVVWAGSSRGKDLPVSIAADILEEYIDEKNI